MTGYVYGDNCVLKGTRSAVHKFFEDLNVYMWVKNEGVLEPSPSQGDTQSVLCLNRTFRWVRGDGGPDAIEIEPGVRIINILLEQFGLEGCNPVVTP